MLPGLRPIGIYPNSLWRRHLLKFVYNIERLELFDFAEQLRNFNQVLAWRRGHSNGHDESETQKGKDKP